MKDDAPHRFQRLLRLLSTIQEHPGQSAQALAEQFGTSKRNLFRDIKLLQDSGFPISNNHGYRVNNSAQPATSVLLLEQGLHAWDQVAAGPVKIEIKLEPWLTQKLLKEPLHNSQSLQNNYLTLLVSGPDRVLDWLMSNQGAELIHPLWLRHALQRRALQLLQRYDSSSTGTVASQA